MSIARLVLFVLAVASTPLSTLASLFVDAAQHSGYVAGSSSAFVEAVRQATEQFRYTLLVDGVLDATRAAVAHGPNLDQLRELETKWDPDNFFRQNVNVLPRSAGTA